MVNLEFIYNRPKRLIFIDKNPILCYYEMSLPPRPGPFLTLQAAQNRLLPRSPQ